MNESTTRKELIDIQLKLAGWNVNDRTQVVEEYLVEGSINNLGEPEVEYKSNQFSDYVLLSKSGKPLAVVEAKRTTKDAALGREQAKQYCYDIQKLTNDILPFCFYTNGHDIYFWDLGNAPPRKVIGYPTRADLERYLHIRDAKKPLTSELINTEIAGRDYQLRAIRSVMDELEKKDESFFWLWLRVLGKPEPVLP